MLQVDKAKGLVQWYRGSRMQRAVDDWEHLPLDLLKRAARQGEVLSPCLQPRSASYTGFCIPAFLFLKVSTSVLLRGQR